MDVLVNIGGYQIKVHLKRHTVHLVANHELMKAMKAGFFNIEELCQRILDLHEQYFDNQLKITLNSFIMEVLGHAYAYKILLKLRRGTDATILRRFSLNACKIDCGDSEHDQNRWFWNLTSFLKPVIFLGVRKV